ncbi:MAG: SBBP repeat-containing protein [Bacteroidota bacterium]
MKTFILKAIMLLMLMPISVYAQDVKFEWARVFGDKDEDYLTAIAVDDAGNVYATGMFTGRVDFDPSDSVYNLETVNNPNSYSNSDIFIAKYDSIGNFVWAKQIGSAISDLGNSIAVDEAGNVVVTGSFCRIVDFDPGPEEFKLTVTGDTVAGTSDIFVCKFDSAGNFLWARNMGGVIIDIGKSVTLDRSGNIYTTGLFIAEGDFDPGNDTFKLVSPYAPYTECNIFLSKLDPNGNFIWAKRMGGQFKSWGNSIAVDDFENVYTTGRFDSIGDFDPGMTNFNMASNGKEDIFISKLDSDGNFVWAKQIGGSLTDEANFITVDYQGNLIITGSFQGQVDYDPGTGILLHNAVQGADVFIEKLNSNGELIWMKTFAGVEHCLGKSITTDPLGNIYSTGTFSYKIDFDPGTEEFFLQTTTKNVVGDTVIGNYDVYISKLDENGNFIWAKRIGALNMGNNHGNSIKVDITGSIYTAGWMQGTSDFDPEPDTTKIFGKGMRDIFIHKMSQQPFFAAPSGLRVQTQDDGFALLQWKDNSTNEVGFIIEKNMAGAGWIILDSVSNNITSFIDRTAKSGAVLTFYRVSAYNDSGNSGYSRTSVVDLALSINDAMSLDEIEVFPNPTSGRIIIETPFKNEQNIQIEIYTLEGNLLKEFSSMPQSKLHIDLSDQPQGTYLLKLTSGAESFMAKVNIVR